ncbi:acetyltransferase [Amniculicola lignicola CBS 123094]|uniref:Acetyltransferase n=1 Tax=Amniculicola lignicola CBS 123094 TaxID=1392246 RepID=A0A6A5W4H9_9PLEO|nr:acetyltransferase [Amniculicola lignicola CBS 123094]
MKSSPIATRLATTDDAEEIRYIGAQVFTTTYGREFPPHDLQVYLGDNYSLTAITDTLLDSKRSTIVAVDDKSKILGFALLTRGSSDHCIDQYEKKIEVQRVYVSTEHHGKGVGKLLLQEADVLAKKEGLEYIWLGVWEEGHRAQKVYGAAGYKKAGEHGFPVGGTVHNDFIMIKEL